MKMVMGISGMLILAAALDAGEQPRQGAAPSTPKAQAAAVTKGKAIESAEITATIPSHTFASAPQAGHSSSPLNLDSAGKAAEEKYSRSVAARPLLVVLRVSEVCEGGTVCYIQEVSAEDASRIQPVSATDQTEAHPTGRIKAPVYAVGLPKLRSHAPWVGYMYPCGTFRQVSDDGSARHIAKLATSAERALRELKIE